MGYANAKKVRTPDEQLVHINRGSFGWITSVCLPRIKKVPATKAGTVSMAGGGVSVIYIFGRRARNAASSSSVGIWMVLDM